MMRKRDDDDRGDRPDRGDRGRGHAPSAVIEVQGGRATTLWLTRRQASDDNRRRAPQAFFRAATVRFPPQRA